MNLLLVRASTLSCSNLPAVSVPTSSLPLSSLALKSCCIAEVRNDTQVLGQMLVGMWCMPSTKGMTGLCTGLLQQGDSSAWFALEGWKKVT